MTSCLKLIHWNNIEVSDSTQNEVTATSCQGQMNALSPLRFLIEKL